MEMLILKGIIYDLKDNFAEKLRLFLNKSPNAEWVADVCDYEDPAEEMDELRAELTSLADANEGLREELIETKGDRDQYFHNNYLLRAENTELTTDRDKYFNLLSDAQEEADELRAELTDFADRFEALENARQVQNDLMENMKRRNLRLIDECEAHNCDACDNENERLLERLDKLVTENECLKERNDRQAEMIEYCDSRMNAINELSGISIYEDIECDEDDFDEPECNCDSCWAEHDRSIIDKYLSICGCNE